MFSYSDIVAMSLRDLESLSSSELKTFLDSFDNVLCDCDGVIWLAYKPFPGINESLSKLRECGKQIRFVSNNGTGGLAKYQEVFNSLKLGAEIGDIVFPTLAIIDYLKRIKYDKEIFVLGTLAMKKEFVDAGFKLADVGPYEIEESFAEVIRLSQDNENVGAVVVDVDININYQKLLKCATYLRRPEVLFITGATDTKITVGTTTMIVGPGYFQNALEDFTGRVPVGFGKPALNFNKYIMKKFNIQDTSRTLFVGDSLEHDMAFASICGYQKLLVLTGITSLDDVTKCKTKDFIPDFYMSGLGNLHGLIKAKLNI